MKLTVEQNPETIKRYTHIRPASGMRVSTCANRCPGTSRRCSRERGHRGPHVAHGTFMKVVAVWDDHAQAEEDRRKPAPAPSRSPTRAEDPVPVWRIYRSFLPTRPPSIETAALLILFLGMVGFVIDWALRILAGQ